MRLPLFRKKRETSYRAPIIQWQIVVWIFAAFCGLAYADDFQPEQRLFIELIPAENKLKGKAEIRVSPKKEHRIGFFLAEHAEIVDARIDGRKVPYEFSNGTFSAQLPETAKGRIAIEVDYEAVFADPVPVLPANMDNPGFGVAGSIGKSGVFLLSGAGWYPQGMGDDSSCLLEVKAPRGMIAVTAGRYLGADTDGEYTVSRWQIRHAPEGLALSAAEYLVLEKKAGGIDIMTFFLPGNADLAKTYLDATENYIVDYEKLFGPYPFEKFAVVENFFPTGYGFASYTLLGSRVLRLPFIVHTSLGHEIAHCWWGNGVLPDYSEGNWSEGLTAYVADYLFKERKSAQDAREQRLQWLRNYAALVDQSDDFPVARFRSRVDPATKVVGYDKSAMFFHMLRKKVGDEIFWDGLRAIYKKYLFKKTSWDDFENMYENLSGQSLDTFFRQWIRRAGAPSFSVEDVSVEKAENGAKVTGNIVQQPPFYDLDIEIVLETETSKLRKTVKIDGDKASFEFSTAEGPEVLTADPGVEIFRKLHESEIPPTINSLKASDSMIAALAGDNPQRLRSTAIFLMRSLGVDRYQIVEEKDVTMGRIANADILWIGLPANLGRFANVPDTANLGPVRFRLNGVSYDSPEDAFFGVFASAVTEDRVAGLFLPLSDRAAGAAIRKITHYGKYSYLAFAGGRNRDKGTWQVQESPLIRRLGKTKYK